MVSERPRVLVLDDEPNMREVLKRGLTLGGYDCVAVASASRVTELLQHEKFDLMLLDILMPEKSGTDVLPEVLAQDPDMTVIMLTAVVDTQIAVEAMRSGAADYVTKPVDLGELMTQIGRALDERTTLLRDRDYRQNLEKTSAEQTERLKQGMRQASVLNKLIQTERKRAEDELRWSRQRIVNVQENVRREIAMQLHGSIQSKLIVLKHQLNQLEGEAASYRVITQLRKLQAEHVDPLYEEARSISHQLYPAILGHSLVSALQGLCENLEPTLVVETEWDERIVRRERGDRSVVPEHTRLAVYRIAEEALNNVLKHAEASRVVVGLELTARGELRLVVRDDGHGFDIDSAIHGLGMMAMQDYAEAVGGEETVRSTVCNGTEVIATFPVDGLEEEHL